MIITPWGKFKYQRLHVGVTCPLDIFQEKIFTLMEGLEYARAYLYYLLVLSIFLRTPRRCRKITWLTMGVMCAPEFFQEKMSTLMEGLEYTHTYLDDMIR